MIKGLVLLACFSMFCCGNTTENKSSDPIVRENQTEPPRHEKSGVKYDLDRPSETHVLDSKLEEISGLGFDEESNTLITNDDESGYYYELDSKTFKIETETKFSKKGDFEAIEKVGNNIFVCKSNGTIHSFDLVSKETTKHKTKLSSHNDVEGLCYLAEKKLLLLACKGQPLGETKGHKKTKAIYSYDLDTGSLNANPYVSISDAELLAQLELSNTSRSKSKTNKLENKVKDFAPSGIAIHPKTRDIYIISARGSSLVILDKNTTIQSLHFLNSKTIPQPEGITFDSKGNLYISTEGHGFSGKIFKFDIIP